jgi:ribokinase
MICVLGDAHLDVVVRLAAPLAEETDTLATTSVGVGGQGANVAAWVTALGGRSRLISALGTDLAAELVRAELLARDVELAGPVLPGRTGVVVSLSDGGQRRSMLTDRGVGADLAAPHITAGWLAGCDWLHVSAYAFAREAMRGAALACVAAARAASGRVSVDLASTAMIESVGVAAFGDILTAVQPDTIFGNGAEAALLGSKVAADCLIVKLGPDGVRAAGKHYPALPTVPVDATGAGDAFAAGYLLGGVELGLVAAARAVAEMGAMPCRLRRS